jgi:hypothetical protein
MRMNFYPVPGKKLQLPATTSVHTEWYSRAGQNQGQKNPPGGTRASRLREDKVSTQRFTSGAGKI